MKYVFGGLFLIVALTGRVFGDEEIKMISCAKTKYLKEIFNTSQYNQAKKEKLAYDQNDPRSPVGKLIGDRVSSDFYRALDNKKIPKWVATPKDDFDIEKSNHCFIWKGSEWYGLFTPNRGQFATWALNLTEKYLLFYVDTTDKSGKEVMVNVISPNRQILNDFVEAKPIDF